MVWFTETGVFSGKLLSDVVWLKWVSVTSCIGYVSIFQIHISVEEGVVLVLCIDKLSFQSYSIYYYMFFSCIMCNSNRCCIFR